jgi:hypothetical protein
MSTNTGTPPASTIDSVVLTNVCDVVITSSPGLIVALSEHMRAFVPDPTEAHASAPVYAVISVSKRSTRGPVMKLDVSNTFFMASSISLFASCIEHINL